MARQTSLRDLAPIITAAETWFREAAIHDRSVFGKDPLWTPNLIKEVRQAFVERPDEGGDSFVGKLRGQLADASPDTKRLMGEMLWITLLFPTNVKAETKRALVIEIWNLGGTSLATDHPLLSDVLLEGIGSGGQGFNNYRWKELVYLVTWIERFKLLPHADRVAVLGDYDRFLAFNATLPVQGDRQFRHMLRYFAFPDRVERMCANGERRKVLAAFRQIPDRELKKWGDRELDTAMLSLRRELEAEHPNKRLDFYEPPLRQRWLPDEEPAGETEDEPTLNELDPTAPRHHWWMNFNPKFFDIEAKPDGHREPYTTHNDEGRPRNQQAAFEAVKPGDLIIGYSTTPRLCAAVLCKITRSIHESDEGRAIEIQRVRALDFAVPRSTMTADPRLKDTIPLRTPQGSLFPLTPAQFEAIMELSSADTSAPPALALNDSAPAAAPAKVSPTPIKPYTQTDAHADLFMSEEKLAELRDQLARKKNLVIQGPPGVGKTFVARRLAYLLMGAMDESRVEIVQFHPSMSYEDFVMGLRPDPKAGGFTLKPGVFHRFCQKARANPGQPHVFIIDEINRGNLAKIFGELMMLIETDKRGDQHAVTLAYESESSPRFSVPANLYLVGTMNTADRSLALVDYALRRRFAFVGLEPEFGERFQAHLAARACPADFVQSLCTKLKTLNDQIAADTRSLGFGYQIGHSYFCGEGQISAPESWLREIVRFEIRPLLEEYWMDDPKRAQAEAEKLLKF